MNSKEYVIRLPTQIDYDFDEMGRVHYSCIRESRSMKFDEKIKKCVTRNITCFVQLNHAMLLLKSMVYLSCIVIEKTFLTVCKLMVNSCKQWIHLGNIICIEIYQNEVIAEPTFGPFGPFGPSVQIAHQQHIRLSVVSSLVGCNQ